MSTAMNPKIKKRLHTTTTRFVEHPVNKFSDIDSKECASLT